MSIVFAILLFSLLIFVHELGHFIAAKLSGVQVNEFAMFMGPALVKWGKGETQYSIRCIPIGGYCAMEGEDEDTDNPRSFQKAAWWKRLIILVAGSGMNFIAGLLIYLALFLPMEQVTVPEITQFEDCCIFNSEEGLQIGDEILSIDGEKVLVNNDISTLLTLKPTRNHTVVIRRGDVVMELRDLPMAHTHVDEEGKEYLHYGFGFGRPQTATLGDKVKYTLNVARDDVRMVRLSLQMLLTGEAGFKDMGGPVLIVKTMSEVAEASGSGKAALLNMLSFGAFIAINLAVMNLLPIPALDGGRVVGLLLTTAIEAVTKKKIDPKYEGYIHGAGMILLLGLMAVIMFKDIFTIFKG